MTCLIIIPPSFIPARFCAQPGVGQGLGH